MTLTVDAAFTIDANGDESMAVARISDTRSIVLYRDTATSAFEARVVEVDEDIFAAEIIEADAFAGSGLADIAVLSSTKAVAAWVDDVNEALEVGIITISGTSLTLVGASIELVTNGSIDSGSVRLINPSSAAFVLVHSDSGAGAAYGTYFTVSGNTITEESQAAYDGNVANNSLGQFSSIKYLVAYSDSDDSEILKMCVLSVSGTTISAGSPVNIEASDVGSGGENGETSQAPLDGSHVLLAYINATDKALKAVVITVSGTVPSANAPVEVDTWTVAAIEDAALVDFSSSQFGLTYDDNIAELGVTGTTVTDSGTISLTGDTPAGTRAVMFTSTKGIAVYSGSAKGVIITASAAVSSALDMAPMRKPAAVDADGTSIYLALLNSSTFPVLIKIAAALDADGSIVFNPGAGSDIGVQAGNFNGSVIWIAGAFDGTNVIEKSEDAGSAFVVKDPATFGGVTTFAVGPDSDDKILVIDDNQDIHETIDDGSNWVTHQTAVGIASTALARLDKNTQEIVVGNVAAANINIQYSVNSGDDLQDYSTGFPEQDVSGVTVG